MAKVKEVYGKDQGGVWQKPDRCFMWQISKVYARFEQVYDVAMLTRKK